MDFYLYISNSSADHTTLHQGEKVVQKGHEYEPKPTPQPRRRLAVHRASFAVSGRRKRALGFYAMKRRIGKRGKQAAAST